MALLKIGELTLEHFLDLILGNFWRLWAIRGVQFWASCFILGTHHRAIITNEYKTDDRSINPGYDCDDRPQIEPLWGLLETQFAVFIFISAISCSLWFSEKKNILWKPLNTLAEIIYQYMNILEFVLESQIHPRWSSSGILWSPFVLVCFSRLNLRFLFSFSFYFRHFILV